MASDYDPTEFVDGDFNAPKSPHAAAAGGSSQRAPTMQEVDSRVVEQQQKLAELKRAQEEKERELAMLEETRRRQLEFQTGRQEMIHSLTRGLGLLEESEFNTRRDAEQMAKALVDLREALTKIEAIKEESWGGDDFEIELTRALTTLENARMEWNSARLKFGVLDGRQPEEIADADKSSATPLSGLAGARFSELCRLGLALTWPVAIAAIVIIGLLVALLVRR